MTPAELWMFIRESSLAVLASVSVVGAPQTDQHGVECRKHITLQRTQGSTRIGGLPGALFS
jgi:hypothetical protein